MTKQEYRQKVEEIIRKYEQSLYWALEEEGHTFPPTELVDELVSLYEETPGFPADDENTAVPGKPEGLTLKQQIEIIVNDHDGKYQKGKVNAILSLLEPMQEKPESMQNIEGIKEKFNKQFACMKFNDVYWDFFEPYLQPQSVSEGDLLSGFRKWFREWQPTFPNSEPESVLMAKGYNLCLHEMDWKMEEYLKTQPTKDSRESRNAVIDECLAVVDELRNTEINDTDGRVDAKRNALVAIQDKLKALKTNGGVSKPDQRFSDFREFLADNCYDLKKFKEGKYDRKIFKWFQPDLTETVREVVGGVTIKVTKKHDRPVEPISEPDDLIEEILRACFDSEYNGFNFARAERELSTLIKNLAYLTITRKKKAFRERFTEEGSFKVYGTPNEVFDFFLEDYDEKVQ